MCSINGVMLSLEVGLLVGSWAPYFHRPLSQLLMLQQCGDSLQQLTMAHRISRRSATTAFGWPAITTVL